MDLQKVWSAAADALQRQSDELGRLDSLAGDGDLGRTAVRIADALRGAAESAAPDTSIGELLVTSGRGVASAAPSSCGNLVATGLLAAGKQLRESGAGGSSAARAFDAARDAIARRGKAAPGDRTLLDALGPAAEAAHGTSAQLAASVADAAERGVEATRSMVPRIGRARFSPEKVASTPDGGALLVAALLRGAASAAN